MKDHDCCYANCPEPGVVHVGETGGDSHWICHRHLDRWNQTRAGFVAAGVPCAMEELGEVLDEE